MNENEQRTSTPPAPDSSGRESPAPAPGWVEYTTGNSPDATGNSPDATGNSPDASGMRDRAQTPAEALPAPPGAPGAPASVPPPGEPRDVWRDRFRVARDGAVYLAIALIAYKLRMADKLDIGTSVFLLLVAGVRAQNVGEFLAARAGLVAPGSRSSMMLAAGMVGASGANRIDLETVRSFFRS